MSAITATGRVTKDFDFCDQLRRAAGGPGPNIAEGFARYGPKEFAHYLRMAVGSLMETQTFLLRGERQGYWSEDEARTALRLCDRALDMTRKLLASKVKQIEESKSRTAGPDGKKPH